MLPGTSSVPLPYIAYDEHSAFNLALQHHLQRQHEIAQLKVITSNLHAASIHALVSEGYGVGWLPMRLFRSSDSKLMRAGDTHWDVLLKFGYTDGEIIIALTCCIFGQK
ncbi:hypothetical protein P4S72_08875 [Vibrio sp. PP-XX7]